MNADVEKHSTLVKLVQEVDYSGERLLGLLRNEMSDEEAIFLNTFNDMSLYDRLEMLLLIMMNFTRHLDSLQDEVDTVAPIVATMADSMFNSEENTSK